MTAKPPSDDSQLPKLRRFRFLPDDPKVAREVGPDGQLLEPTEADTPPQRHDERPHQNTARQEDSLQEDSRPAPDLGTAQDARDTTSERRRAQSDDDLRESEQLLAALESSLGPRPATAPTSQDDVRTAPPTAPATAGRGSDANDPPRPVAPATESNHRAARAKSWPFLAAGVALAVVIAIVVWLVTRPGDGQDANQEGNAPAEATGELTAAEWADSMCTELSEFQTTAVPLRAATAKASASSAATDQNVDQLRREASELLTDLATELQEVGMPTDSTDAAGVHTTVLSAVNAAASSANPSVSPSPDADITPAETATEILSALDRPLVVFQQTVSELAVESRDEISTAPACASLL